MKTAILTLFIATLSLTGFSQQEELDHMNDLTATFENLKNDTWGYMKALTKGKSDQAVEKKRVALVAQYKKEKARISKIKDSEFKTAMEEYVDLSINVLEEEFNKILDMEAISEQSFDAMEAYMMAKDQAADKLNKAADDVVAVQTSYAEANGITLFNEENDELANKIEKAGKALTYYNEVYLIYFKPNMEESYAIDAISRMDVGALDQNISSLESYAEEGLEKLKELGSYEGYAGLKVATDKLLKFYIKEAKESFPSISEFYVAQERFSAAEEVINSKNKKKLTQEDIDTYNAASTEYNEAVDAYNKSIDYTNNERTRLIDAWNKAVERFFETQTD